MSKHTPTPWQARENGIYNGPELIATTSTERNNYEANAAFVVRAVNSHAALVDALQDVGRLLYREGYSYTHPAFGKLRKALRAAGVEP